MDASDIEHLNALAPFDHGVWEGKSSDGEKIKVGEKALFRSRSEWLVDKISTYLTIQFSPADLKKMSVLEVASYDGWVLTQICKRIEFAEAVGVEPRRKNILKGEAGRRLAKIKTQAKFIQGGAEGLAELFPGREFDIVICLGMLHHVSSTYDTISSVCKKSKNVTIIDSMIIPELQEDVPKIEPYVNTRDIIYHGEEGTWTIAAFKYESPYGDGSRSDFGIVNLPSARLIEMSLRTCGFSNVGTLGSEADFFDDSGQQLRGVKEFLCVSRREIAQKDIDRKWQEKVRNSENIFCHVTLPDDLIVSLSKVHPDFATLSAHEDVNSVNIENGNYAIDSIAREIILKGVDKRTLDSLRINIPEINEAHIQILSVLFRSPYEKTMLEIAKFFLGKNLPDLAIKYLTLIVRKPGCDWWSFYRSCYILRESFKKLGEKDRANHYQDLLFLSNENFPF